MTALLKMKRQQFDTKWAEPVNKRRKGYFAPKDI